MTLAVYIAWLISQGRTWVDLTEVQARFAEIEALMAFAGIVPPVYVISEAAKAEVYAQRKISAIKIVRTEHPLVDGATIGLRAAKAIVDAYAATLPPLAEWERALLRS